MSRKTSRKHARRRARENALAILYSSDIIESDASRIVEEGLYPAGDIHLSEYAEMLVQGVSEHLEEIDSKLEATSENWALDRMPVVDRAILRLAVYEMLFVDEVPVSVAINEAVELAKSYGGEDESSRFVNGVLGRISRLGEASEAAGGESGEGAFGEGALTVEPTDANGAAAEEMKAADPADGKPAVADLDAAESGAEDGATVQESALDEATVARAIDGVAAETTQDEPAVGAVDSVDERGSQSEAQAEGEHE